MPGAVESRKLEQQLNASGYPLQLALRHEIERGRAERIHSWEVEVEELPWEFASDHGFADLVVRHGNTRLIVECKRQREPGHWIFGGARPRRTREVRFRRSPPQRQQIHGTVQDGHWGPECFEAEFCTTGRQSGVSGHSLVPMCRTLLAAVDAIAHQSDGLASLGFERHHYDMGRTFFPVIATSARLHIHLGGDAIDLASGDVDSPTFEEVPYVRFRQSFFAVPYDRVAEDGEPSLTGLRRLAERTVFVVRADAFTSFLSSAG